jgi:hypothetical protein
MKQRLMGVFPRGGGDLPDTNGWCGAADCRLDADVRKRRLDEARAICAGQEASDGHLRVRPLYCAEIAHRAQPDQRRAIRGVRRDHFTSSGVGRAKKV